MSLTGLNLSRRTLLAGLAGLSVAPLVACNATSSSSGGDLATVRVGYQAATDYGLFYIGQQKGWFAEAGVDLQLTLFTSGDAQIEALASGATDLSLQGAQPALIATQQGVADLRFLAPIADAGGLFSVVADPSISTVEGLAGRKVAFQIGSAYEYYLDNVLASYNMSQADIEVVNLDPLDGQGAFLSGNVDAVIPLATSRYTILEHRPDANVIFTPEDFESAPSPRVFSVYDLIIVNGESLDANREAVEGVVRTFLDRIVPYVTSEDTREDAIAELVTWQTDVVNAQTDAESVRQLIESYGFYDAAGAEEVLTGGEFAEQLQGQAEFLVEADALDGVPDMDTMVEESVVEAVVSA